MKKTAYKIICAVLAVSMAALTLSSCKGNDEPETIANTEGQSVTQSDSGSTTAAPLETETGTQAATDVVTDVSTEKSTESQSDSTTKAGETTKVGETTKAGETTTKKSTKPATQAEILNYFNTSVNRVKPQAKSVLKNYEKNTQVADLDLSKLKSVVKLANSLIEKNMGYKEGHTNLKLDSKEKIKQYFPLEGETWSSKLTMDNVENVSLKEKNGKYVITVQLKDDAPSDKTTHGNGNAGKAMSVIAVQTIYDNAGAAKSLIKNVKIGYSDSKIVATIDPATGNITDINYYYAWELCLTALGIDVSVTFGIEQDYDVKW